MFKRTIHSTPLTSDVANSYFRNITGGMYGSDVSFLATLRALVAPRLKDTDRIHATFSSTSYTSETLASYDARSILRSMMGECCLDSCYNTVVVHSFNSDKDSNTANLRLVESKFTSIFEGYHRLDKVKAFYHKSFGVDCYINPDRKNVVIFVESLDTRRLHYLQVSILAFLPWYFDPSVGVSDLEMQLLYSLRETTSDKYEQYIAKIAETYDFRSARVRQLLTGFETRFEQIACEEERRNIQRVERDINDLNSRIGELLMRRNEMNIRLMGLERKIEQGSDDSEIMEYFLCNNKLYLEQVDNSYMYFAVKEYLTYFDREAAERIIDNPRSFVYRAMSDERHNGVTNAEMKKLMTEIFVNEEPRLRIKFCAAYSFNLYGNVSAQTRHNFDLEFANFMPNPHIDRYNCMGNYVRTINQLLERRDYIGAIEQCIASCKSLNWGDSTVMREFMDTMWGDTGYNNRCIELPDGSVVKPIDAIKWLNEQEVKTNAQEEQEA